MILDTIYSHQPTPVLLYVCICNQCYFNVLRQCAACASVSVPGTVRVAGVCPVTLASDTIPRCPVLPGVLGVRSNLWCVHSSFFLLPLLV
jgi:hypothetical protein